jgi:ubiquitin C-terminal hydrolase
MSINIKYGVSVFKNIDSVTCYMNSILAIIQQTPIFADYILTAKFKDILLNKVSLNFEELHKSILFNLYNILRLSHSHDGVTINPILFRQSLIKANKMWGMRQHQDSQELMTFIFNKIEEEISQKVIFIPGGTSSSTSISISSIYILLAHNMWQQFIKKEYSIIKNLFGGMTHILITCNSCKNISHNFDIFQILQLSIISSKNLYDCMDEFTKKEKIDNENKILCEFCGVKNQSTKQTLLWKTPKNLIIQLKRFITDDYGQVSNKLTNMIEYPVENLDITKYIDPLSPDINKSKYNLYAVNCHQSFRSSINFGHYTSIIKNRYDDKWYIANDACKLEETTDIITENAYLLFYSRID